jgi:hypothetical protein
MSKQVNEQWRNRIVGHGEESPENLLANERKAVDWKAVVGFEETYEVSDSGDIRRVGSGRGAKLGRILQQADHPQGYKLVSLWKENKGTNFLVHRVVAMAFLGPVPTGTEVNHINGDKADNRPENLEYVTRKENIHHAMQTGLTNVLGEDNPCAKLTYEQVREIRRLHVPGKYGYKRLAAEFGVSWEAIRNIIKGYAWASA